MYSILILVASSDSLFSLFAGWSCLLNIMSLCLLPFPLCASLYLSLAWLWFVKCLQLPSSLSNVSFALVFSLSTFWLYSPVFGEDSSLLSPLTLSLIPFVRNSPLLLCSFPFPLPFFHSKWLSPHFFSSQSRFLLPKYCAITAFLLNSAKNSLTFHPPVFISRSLSMENGDFPTTAACNCFLPFLPHSGILFSPQNTKHSISFIFLNKKKENPGKKTQRQGSSLSFYTG